MTLYSPASTLGTVKVTEEAEAAEGLTSDTRPVFLLVRTTTGVPRLRFDPLRVIAPAEMELVEMLDRTGD